MAEIQGLYGPFSFPEKLLQKIWSNLDFDQQSTTTQDGRRLRIITPGRWNHFGGPDFMDARLEIEGEHVTGDVELHLHASDWNAHRHADDPAYRNVVLHVILFPAADQYATGFDGAPIAQLTLLPLLNHDLEEYAADEAIQRLADHPLAKAKRELLTLDHDTLTARLVHHAMYRWTQKVHFARMRVAKLGWTEACHQTALEILGYRHNRSTMLAVATRYPFPAWTSSPTLSPETIYEMFAVRWSRQGVRPANHPRVRLGQYARWISACPDWPQRLIEAGRGLPSIAIPEAVPTRRIRRLHHWTELVAKFNHRVMAGAVGGTRQHTLVCDGLLPLLAAHSAAGTLDGIWYTWPVGDVPANHGRLLRELGCADGKENPLCHGILQGLIGWLIANEDAEVKTTAIPEGSGA